MKKKVAVIGSGFAGMSAACHLAKAGLEVHLFEKNSTIGGRARSFSTENGYMFDMGPSWYWMPDVFEDFFNAFGHSSADFYHLTRLNPSFSIVFGKDDILNIPSDFDELCELFESIEKGSAIKLINFMKEAEFKYEIGMRKLVHKPGLSLFELLDFEVIQGIFKLQIFNSFRSHVKSFFSHPKLVALMEFPVLFLGAMPPDIPALYSLMNYAGLKLGNWYPMGGFVKVIEGMAQVAKENGVHFHTNSEVESISSKRNQKRLLVNNQELLFDGVIASADYQHVEEKLLETSNKNYTSKYWESKTFAPSALIFYLGINKRIPKLEHHTLFFDADIDLHAIEIYKKPQYPSNPLFYVCCPSKTDNHVAPKGHENIFILMPIATDLSDTEEIREKYFNIITTRLTEHLKEDIRPYIDYKKSYCVKDFKQDYNAYKGNAYGLANTLAQTANLKPSIKNKHIDNLYYAGQLTVPGPGVPPSIISGKVAAGLLINNLNL